MKILPCDDDLLNYDDFMDGAKSINDEFCLDMMKYLILQIIV